MYLSVSSYAYVIVGSVAPHMNKHSIRRCISPRCYISRLPSSTLLAFCFRRIELAIAIIRVHVQSMPIIDQNCTTWTPSFSSAFYIHISFGWFHIVYASVEYELCTNTQI